MSAWHRMVGHVGPPALLSLAMVGLYFTPVDVFGCAGRGYFALAIALLGVLGTLSTMVVAARAKRAGDPGARWWILTATLLLSPAYLLVALG